MMNRITEKFSHTYYDIQRIKGGEQTFFNSPYSMRDLAHTNMELANTIGDGKIFVINSIEYELIGFDRGIEGAVRFFAASYNYATFSLMCSAAGIHKFDKPITLTPNVNFGCAATFYHEHLCDFDMALRLVGTLERVII